MTMRKILVCNQKGGVGKSLIADELVFSFERSGIPVAFLDLDGQGGTIHKTDRNEDAEVAVVDTPGALQPQLKAWLFDADLIIIPTRTTSRDIEPLCRMKEAVEAAGKSDHVDRDTIRFAYPHFQKDYSYGVNDVLSSSQRLLWQACTSHGCIKP